MNVDIMNTCWDTYMDTCWAFKGDMFSKGSRTYFSKAWTPPPEGGWGDPDKSPTTKILGEYIHRLIRKSCSFARESHIFTKESYIFKRE